MEYVFLRAQYGGLLSSEIALQLSFAFCVPLSTHKKRTQLVMRYPMGADP